MLFYLNYIQHDVEKLHDLLVFFFNKVETDNPDTFNHAIHLPEWYNNTTNRMQSLESYLTEFLTFDKDIKGQIIKSFKAANKIEFFFSSLDEKIPTAKDFKGFAWKTVTEGGKEKNYTITDFLKSLFIHLYEDQLGNKESTFSKKIKSNLNEYYQSLVEKNKIDYQSYTVCPICGLEKMRDEENIRKPDQDHLLPKGDELFVFSSVNLKNLFPIGSDCNIKKGTDPLLYKDNDCLERTLAFYPFDNQPHPFEQYTISLICDETPGPLNLFKGRWKVEIIPKNNLDKIVNKKIETWDRVFDIKNRIAKVIRDSHRAFLGNDLRITKINTQEELREKVKEQINRYGLEYLIITTEVDLIPKYIFYQWACNEPAYLDSYIANNAKGKMNTKVDVDF